MPVNLDISILKSPQGGVDMSFQAVPSNVTADEEIELANQLVAICGLMSDPKFQEHIKAWVEPEINKLQAEQEGANPDKYRLLM